MIELLVIYLIGWWLGPFVWRVFVAAGVAFMDAKEYRNGWTKVPFFFTTWWDLILHPEWLD